SGGLGSGRSAGSDGLTYVEDVGEGNEDIGAIGEEPQGLGAGTAGRHELAVVDPSSVAEGQADLSPFEDLDCGLGHDCSLLTLCVKITRCVNWCQEGRRLTRLAFEWVAVGEDACAWFRSGRPDRRRRGSRA